MKALQIVDQTALDRVLNLLRENKLPHQDVNLSGNLFYSYEDENGNLIGAGGLELYNDHALLRSVVVAKQHQGKTIGKSLVIDLMERAKSNSLKSVYLLTETASEFFKKLGFKSIARENVPSQIKSSSEFASVCPVSAVCMQLELT